MTFERRSFVLDEEDIKMALIEYIRARLDIGDLSTAVTSVRFISDDLAIVVVKREAEIGEQE